MKLWCTVAEKRVDILDGWQHCPFCGSSIWYTSVHRQEGSFGYMMTDSEILKAQNKMEDDSFDWMEKNNLERIYLTRDQLLRWQKYDDTKKMKSYQRLRNNDSKRMWDRKFLLETWINEEHIAGDSTPFLGREDRLRRELADIDRRLLK